LVTENCVSEKEGGTRGYAKGKGGTEKSFWDWARRCKRREQFFVKALCKSRLRASMERVNGEPRKITGGVGSE